jgi:hypothetical protein
MHCNECGSEVPSGSRFCNTCGSPTLNISNQSSSSEQLGHAARMDPETQTLMTAKEQAAPSYIVEPEKPQSRTPQILLVLLGIAVVAFVALAVSKMGHRQSSGTGVTTQARATALPIARAETVKLAGGAFIVQPGRYSFSKFIVPQKCVNVRMQGRFTTSGGVGNGIELYVLNKDELANWQNGHQAHMLYNSGRVTTKTINLRLPSTSGEEAATYYMVFNNKFSNLAKKAVTADISLHYDRTP